MLNFGLDMGVEEESGDPASVTFDGDPDVTFDGDPDVTFGTE